MLRLGVVVVLFFHWNGSEPQNPINWMAQSTTLLGGFCCSLLRIHCRNNRICSKKKILFFCKENWLAENIVRLKLESSFRMNVVVVMCMPVKMCEFARISNFSRMIFGKCSQDPKEMSVWKSTVEWFWTPNLRIFIWFRSRSVGWILPNRRCWDCIFVSFAPKVFKYVNEKVKSR